MPLRSALATYADTQPDALAVKIDARAVTYGALWLRCQAIDAYVSSLPRAARSDADLSDVPLFALHMGNTPYVAEFLAAALAGHSCMMLIDPLLPIPQVEAMLADLNPDVVFTSAPPETAPKCQAPCISIRCEADIAPLLSTPAKDQTTQPTAPFMIGFTSGTTSRPKAFVRHRDEWQRSLARGRAHFGMHAGMHTLSPGPLVHGLSLYAFAETLEAGAAFHTVSQFSAQTVGAHLGGADIRRLVSVPTMLDGLIRAGVDLSPLKQITTAGAKLSQPLRTSAFAAAPMAQITEYYGASELGFVTTASYQSETDPDQGVGCVFPGLSLEIRDPDADGCGEIWVRSDLAISGYLRSEGQSAFKAMDDAFSVGDIGHLDARDQLHLKARSGGMVISGGNNIYPDEVIQHLTSHPAIARAEVFGVDDDYLGQKLVAIIAIEPGVATPSLAEIDAHCRDGLQKYKCPRAVWIAKDWPMTASGKTASGDLRRWLTTKDARLVSL